MSSVLQAAPFGGLVAEYDIQQTFQPAQRCPVDINEAIGKVDRFSGVAAGTARQWLVRSPRRLQWLGATGGTVMILLGGQLAISGRHDWSDGKRMLADWRSGKSSVSAQDCRKGGAVTGVVLIVARIRCESAR